MISTRFRGFLPVVVDLETGGFNARTDALLEIAAVLLTMDEDGIIKTIVMRFRRLNVRLQEKRAERRLLKKKVKKKTFRKTANDDAGQE